MPNNIGVFVNRAIAELNESMPDGWELDHSIQFEVTVTTTETADGKLDIKLFSVGGNSKDEAVQKMNFSITHKAKSDAVEQGQYEAISKGMIAIFKPLQDLGNNSPLPDSNVKPN